jgi:hypothetical protein
METVIIFLGVWVVQEYFKKIPAEYKHKRFPFIS